MHTYSTAVTLYHADVANTCKYIIISFKYLVNYSNLYRIAAMHVAKNNVCVIIIILKFT